MPDDLVNMHIAQQSKYQEIYHIQNSFTKAERSEGVGIASAFGVQGTIEKKRTLACIGRAI